MTRSRLLAIAALTAALALSGAAAGQDAPPITERMVGTSAVVCIRIARTGAVSGAFIVVSTGKPEIDRDMEAWARQLHWPAAKPSDTDREVWFPMGVSFDGPPARKVDSCAPPLSATSRP